MLEILDLTQLSRRTVRPREPQSDFAASCVAQGPQFQRHPLESLQTLPFNEKQPENAFLHLRAACLSPMARYWLPVPIAAVSGP